MKQVFKYPLEHINQKYKFLMPEGAEILTLQLQRGQPCMWALVETDNPSEARVFELVGTGDTLKHDGRYIGTFQLDNGEFVGHLFEI